MSLTADEYIHAWEHTGARAPRLNTRIVPGTCVLETLSMVVDPQIRHVFVDDFGYAVSYCRNRLLADLIPPDERGHGEPAERWWRMRSAFTPSELAISWAAADTAFSKLLDAFIADGYSRALGDRLREVVNTYGLDLELGEVYVFPQDIHAILSRAGNLFAWWDEGVVRPETMAQEFNFADVRHRTMLARWLREANKPA